MGRVVWIIYEMNVGEKIFGDVFFEFRCFDSGPGVMMVRQEDWLIGLALSSKCLAIFGCMQRHWTFTPHYHTLCDPGNVTDYITPNPKANRPFIVCILSNLHTKNLLISCSLDIRCCQGVRISSSDECYPLRRS